MILDTQLFHALNSLAIRSASLDAGIIFFASYLAPLLVLVFVGILIFTKHTVREKIELLVVAVLSVAIARFGITELIRNLFPRPRPFMELSVNSLFTETSWSFPSGHATFFFALSTAVYLYHRTWGKVFFVATVLITLSRVAAGVHYPSDILAGAAIGIVVALGVAYLYRKLTAEKPPLDPLTQ